MPFNDPAGAHTAAGMPVVAREWSEQRIEDENAAGVIYEGCLFDRVEFVGVNLERTIFVHCRFDDCVFEDCTINETVWNECEGSGLRFVGGVLGGGVLNKATMERVDIEQAGYRVTLADCNVDHLAFRGAGREQYNLTIVNCTFGDVLADNAAWNSVSAVDADLRVWSLRDALFTRCVFIRVNAVETDLSEARFESCNLYDSDFRQATFQWAERSIFAESDLTDANMAEASLSGAMFAKAKAPGANFERADLSGALFPEAVLTMARFAGANAPMSVWSDADLTGADLEGLNAFQSVFRNAILKDANLTNARLVETELHGVEDDLSAADTTRSRGTIPWRAEREAEMYPPTD